MTASMARRRRVSRLNAGTSSISAPARSRLAGATNRPLTSVGSMQFSSGTSCISTWYIDVSRPRFSMPRPVEALPCGSRSMISARWPSSARQAPTLIVVVVLPTPPFWLATAMTRGSGRPTGSGTTSSPPPVRDVDEQLLGDVVEQLVGNAHAATAWLAGQPGQAPSCST